MKNLNLIGFTILAPGIVQFGFFPSKILFHFEYDETGKVIGVEVYKRQPLTGKTIWGRYSEMNHASTFYSMVRLEEGLFKGSEVGDSDVGWATRGLHFEHVLDRDFKEIEKTLKNFSEKVCI